MKEHPCMGCQSKVSKRKAPCCWENELELTPMQYENNFKGRPGVVFIRARYDQGSGIDIFVVRNEKACPQLDQQTGLCIIHDNKPECCEQAQALIHPLCCKAPNGRQ